MRAGESFGAVLFLLGAEDVGGAAIAGEQVLAVLGLEQFSKRLDPADDQEQIVLAWQRKYGVDEIVPRALVAQIDFQAVGEERARFRTTPCKSSNLTRTVSSNRCPAALPRSSTLDPSRDSRVSWPSSVITRCC